MKVKLAPSIMCADLLNLEKEIKLLEEAEVDLIHYDIMDTTFTNQTMLPIRAIPLIKKITDIPLDIHVMIDRPERIIETLLPLAKDSYISFHAEATMCLSSLITHIKGAGGKVGVAINSATSVSALEEVIHKVDMITVILGSGGCGPREYLDDRLVDKVKRIKEMIDQTDNEVLLSVDGGVSNEVGKTLKEVGADTFVLGTKAIYREGESVVKLCKEFRRDLL